MSNLSPVEFEQLKSLISRRTLSTGEQTITLDILRSKFSNFFSNLGLTEANLKDDKFLIKYLTESHNRNKIIEALKKELSLSPSQLIELIEALETKPVITEEEGGGEVSGQGVSEQQAVPASTTAGSSAGGMFPGMPSGPSISPGQRRIYRVYRAPEPTKPEIHIANAGGYVTEAGDPSKLVRATESGKIVEKPPSKIFITDKGGVREHAIKPSTGFKFPSAFSNFGKNITSKMGVFIKRNLTPMRLGTVVSGGIGGIAGAGFGPLGVAVGGGLGALAPSWIRSGGATRFLGRVGNGAINAGARLSNSASRLSIPGPGKKWVIGLLGGILLVVGVGFIAAPPDQPGSTTPPPAVYPPYQPGAGSGVITCPLNSGKITTGSKDRGGHCSPGYQTDYPCASPDTTGRSTAVDIRSPDKTVYLPKLNNADVTWTIVKIDKDTDYVANGQTINGGYSVRASAQSQGKNYLLRFVHIEPTSLIQGQTANSEEPVGAYRSQEDHVHITIEEDTVFKPGDTYFNLCK